MSYIGGIWSSSYLVLRIIIVKYREAKYIQEISNKLYNFPSQKQAQKKKKGDEKKNSKNKKKKIPPKNEKDKVKDLQNATNTKTEQDELKTEEIKTMKFHEKVGNKIQEYLEYERKLILGFKDCIQILIESMMCPKRKFKSEKTILFENTKEFLESDLDLTNIIKRLHDLEKLKNLLLNDEQLIIFDYCPKPIVVNDLSEINNDKNRDNNKELSILRRNSSSVRSPSSRKHLKRIKKYKNIEGQNQRL